MARHIFRTVITEQGYHRLVAVLIAFEQMLALKLHEIELIQKRPVAFH